MHFSFREFVVRLTKSLAVIVTHWAGWFSSHISQLPAQSLAFSECIYVFV